MGVRRWESGTARGLAEHWNTQMKVRDMLKRLAEDGWYVHRVRGSHRVLKHPVKTGTVVVAGHPGKDIAIGTFKSVCKQAELEDEP